VIAVPVGVRVLVATKPVDFRRGAESLAALVREITLAFCWAHLRRRFFDIAKGGDAPIASEALERIAAANARRIWRPAPRRPSPLSAARP
jgi:hypothetical protein